MTTIIVIPTYNESQNLPALLPKLAKAVPGAHLLLVDDASPDHTADAAEGLFKTKPEYMNYSVLRRTGARGLGLAYRDGFAYALEHGFERVIQMDADLSHNPADIPALLESSMHADLVIGSRYCAGGKVQNWPRRRILLSKFAGWYVQQVLRIPFTDPTAGFRCWTKVGLQALELETVRSEGYAFQVEMALRAVQARLKVQEVPITFTDRAKGKSKMSRMVLLESMLMPLKLRFQSLFRGHDAFRACEVNALNPSP